MSALLLLHTASLDRPRDADGFVGIKVLSLWHDFGRARKSLSEASAARLNGISLAGIHNSWLKVHVPRRVSRGCSTPRPVGRTSLRTTNGLDIQQQSSTSEYRATYSYGLHKEKRAHEITRTSSCRSLRGAFFGQFRTSWCSRHPRTTGSGRHWRGNPGRRRLLGPEDAAPEVAVPRISQICGSLFIATCARALSPPCGTSSGENGGRTFPSR